MFTALQKTRILSVLASVFSYEMFCFLIKGWAHISLLKHISFDNYIKSENC